MTLAEWNDDNASHLAAALAYYSIFSMTPLLVIGVAIAGAFFGQDATMTRLVSQVERYTSNTEAAAFVGSLVENARRPGATLFASVVSFLMLFYGASGVFYELKTTLNRIWDVPRRESGRIWSVIAGRVATLAMVLVSGVLLFASLVASTVVMGGARRIGTLWPGMESTTQIASFLLFFVITLIVFALVYKYVPDVRLSWSDIWIGAVITALLFSVGRWVISLYLARSTITSTYGAAGSLAALLIWVYYSAQLFFLGAEFTQVYGRTYGSRRREAGLMSMTEGSHERPTVEEWDGTIVPAHRERAAGPRTEASQCRQTEQRVVKSVRTKLPLRQRVTEPIRDLVVAAAVLVSLSIYTVLRQPFRRD